ncbi:MAG: IS1595 family transposase [Verrucomicrobiota bacterium]|nr:IS1595 family transposase [Verrucomicrobiota bacterium]
MNAPETLLEAVQYFSERKNAVDFFVQVRWPKGVACPQCGSKAVTYLAKAGVWKCKTTHPKQKFSAKVGTIFEDSPIGLEKWLPAMWMIVNCKNGISSYELHRALGVTQKTAWFMLQRIRLAMQRKTFGKMSGTCEADETYIGAKARFMHKNKRTGVGHAGFKKTAVQGILERTSGDKPSRVVLKVVPNTRRPELCGNVRDHVEKGATVCTDALMSYDNLSSDYDRQVIDHAVSYAKGHIHTNGLENFWSLLKRALKGTYVNVEPFHLFRYLDEQAFRFNERKNEDGDKGRFIAALGGVVGKGLKYAKLIAAEGGDGPCPAEAW